MIIPFHQGRADALAERQEQLLRQQLAHERAELQAAGEREASLTAQVDNLSRTMADVKAGGQASVSALSAEVETLRRSVELLVAQLGEREDQLQRQKRKRRLAKEDLAAARNELAIERGRHAAAVALAEQRLQMHAGYLGEVEASAFATERRSSDASSVDGSSIGIGSP